MTGTARTDTPPASADVVIPSRPPTAEDADDPSAEQPPEKQCHDEASCRGQKPTHQRPCRSRTGQADDDPIAHRAARDPSLLRRLRVVQRRVTQRLPVVAHSVRSAVRTEVNGWHPHHCRDTREAGSRPSSAGVLEVVPAIADAHRLWRHCRVRTVRAGLSTRLIVDVQDDLPGATVPMTPCGQRAAWTTAASTGCSWPPAGPRCTPESRSSK